MIPNVLVRQVRYQYVYHEFFLKSAPGVLNGKATFVVSEQCPRGSIKLLYMIIFRKGPFAE